MIRDRNTRYFLASHVCSSLATYTLALLLAINVYERSGTAVAVSVLFVVQFLPGLIVAPVASGWVDQLNRGAALVVLEVLRSLLAVAFVFVDDLVALLAITFVMTSLANVAKPIRSSTIPDLVQEGHRLSLNSAVMFCSAAAEFAAGMGATGLVLATGQGAFLAASVLALLGATFAIPLVPLLRTAPEHADSPARGRRSDGFRLIFHEPRLRAITVMNLFLWAALGLHEAGLVVWVTEAAGAPASALGMVVAVGACGSALGSLATPRMMKDLGTAGPRMAPTLFAAASLLLVMSQAQSVVWAAASYAAFSVLYNMALISSSYLEQEVSPRMGRTQVVAATGAVGTIGFLLGGTLSGLISELWGVRFTFAGAAALMLLAGLALLPVVLQWREPAADEAAPARSDVVEAG